MHISPQTSGEDMSPITRNLRATEGALIRVVRYDSDDTKPIVVRQGRTNFADESLTSLRDSDLGIDFGVAHCQPFSPHKPRYTFFLEVKEQGGEWYELGEFESGGHIKPRRKA